MYRSRMIKTSSKKNIILLLVILLMIAAVCVWYFFIRETDPTKSYQPEYPNSVKKQSKEQAGNDNATAADDYKNSSNLDAPSLETAEQIPVAAEGTITITNLNQKDGFVNALASVANFEMTKCVYSFTAPEARPVVREVSGGCSGVSIPQVEFEMIGKYTLTATAYSGSEKLTTTKDIDIK